MSKKYDVPIIGNLYEYSSEYSSSYAAQNALDQSTSTYWRCSAPSGAYLTIKLPRPKKVAKIKLYIGNATYAPKLWTLFGSADGVSFHEVFNGSCTNTTGWQEYTVSASTEYLYFKWVCDSGYNSSRLYLYELDLLSEIEFIFTKADGKYIAIKFDSDLLGDVSGVTPIPIGGWKPGPTEIPIVSVTSSGDYSTSATYSVNNLLDGSTSTYWRSSQNTANNYLIFDMGNAVALGGFDFYQKTIYYVKEFQIFGSNDGLVYDDLGLFENASTAEGWIAVGFQNAEKYRYYKTVFTKVYSSAYINLYEVKAHPSSPIGNERAFKVTGKVYNYVLGGYLIPEEFDVVSVSRWNDSSDTIRLEIDDFDRFESCIGAITVQYSRLLGNLIGKGGAVEDFSEEFTPEQLVWKGDQNDRENVAVSCLAAGVLKKVEYKNTIDREHVSCVTLARGILTHIDDL